MPETLGAWLAEFASSLRNVGAILDIIYSHQSLLTSTGQNGDPHRPRQRLR
jgi:hypothetical protein